MLRVSAHLAGCWVERCGAMLALLTAWLVWSGCPTAVDDDTLDDDAVDDDASDDDEGDDDGTDDDGADDDTSDDDNSDDDGDWAQVSVGENMSCGVHHDGRLDCWGNNTWGQSEPPQGIDFTISAAGTCHGCGLTIDGDVLCWGVPDGDPLDYGQVSGAPMGTFVSLTSNEHNNCALRADHSYVCWGIDAEFWEPMDDEFTELSLGPGLLCGVRPAGTVQCFGANDAGQANAPGGTFVSVSAGDEHSCALTADGSIVCWGCQTPGSEGACDVPPGHTFTHVQAGAKNTCALTNDHEIICWGSNSSLPPERLYSQLASFRQGCAVSIGGAVVCWGCDDPYSDWGHCDPPE